jgi:hypothetical protein
VPERMAERIAGNISRFPRQQRSLPEIFSTSSGEVKLQILCGSKTNKATKGLKVRPLRARYPVLLKALLQL